MTCTLTACRTCTPCAHDQHDRCRGVSYCHTDKTIRACECCGEGK